ncbi:MAG: FAD-binding oxidoreductase [Solirubrobacteraceae bacterium]
MTAPWPTTAPTTEQIGAFADASTRPFWLDDLPIRDPHPRLEGVVDADLCIVGGGFTGLWAALHAARDTPERSVVLLESGRCGEAASGRNGGFLDASLTHGLANGCTRFADEMVALEQHGGENFAALRSDLERHGIAADYEETGALDVALQPHQIRELDELAELMRNFGHEARRLDQDAVRAEVASPTYLAGPWSPRGTALVHPGKLGDGLRGAAVAAGVQIAEHSPVHALRPRGAEVIVAAADGQVRARRVLIGTGAQTGVLPAVRHYIAPVYDYVLVTEPLSATQLGEIGWRHRQGLADGANQFHYYRLTGDDRILFGGYDAVYRYGGPVGPRLEDHAPTFARLSQHFFTTFPQLAGVRFTHRWGGAIDTCSRFAVFFGVAHGGRVAYAAGYTGLGVGASRFGAQVALDLLDGRDSAATALRFTRTRPVPFPPEPLRSAVIQLTRNRLAAADRREGRRGLWLGLLDRFGLGFDS